ncbi:MAG TPA: redox-regulated ATPase YchF [Candidatus Omnitrophota bacterium]|nr:redox-regulated ATPase YchF [Candidatus Omnitrophota bacterium]
MKLGIVGLGLSGKTTVLNALTGACKAVGTYGKSDTNVAVVKVPDERMEWLIKTYNPKKIVYADIEFVDIPGAIDDSSDAKVVAAARETDALVFVVRAFDNPNVPHPNGSVAPERDLEYIKMGLVVNDLSIAEKRLERLRKTAGKGSSAEEEKIELEILERVAAHLGQEKPLSSMGLTEQEDKVIRSFQFLTLKPSLTLLNVSDKDVNSEKTSAFLSNMENSMALSADTEMQIQTLEEADRAAFLEDAGIRELSLNSLIKKAYSTLGLISFFTAGEKEVHAWTIKKGTKAVAAAGKIHSDLERGFIRAEIFSFDDLKKFGSEREVKTAGKFRLEGKEYVVQDGDIVVIKFSV